MRIGRLLLIVGVILVMGAVVIGGIIVLRNRQARSAETPPPAAEATTSSEVPQGIADIVVAAQNIPRGTRITPDNNAVVMGSWPEDALPAGAVGDLEDVFDRVARVDIVLGMPVLDGMLTEQAGDLGGVGSDAALQVPAGMVAYAVPAARYSSAAWALQPGDYVDVIISMLVGDLDEETQSLLLNDMTCLSSGSEQECSYTGPYGQLEVLPNGWLVNVVPSEEQRPRLVTQLTLQNVLVLQVGDWPETQGLAPAPEPTPPPAAEEGAEPTPVPPTPEVLPLTLAVTQQDALVLEYAQTVGTRFTFVLRSAGDGQSVVTESVTLQYLMERFNVDLPPKLPYGINPPLLELERIGRSGNAGVYSGDGVAAGAGGASSTSAE